MTKILFFQSSAAGIQNYLTSFGLLCIVDDMSMNCKKVSSAY